MSCAFVLVLWLWLAAVDGLSLLLSYSTFDYEAVESAAADAAAVVEQADDAVEDFWAPSPPIYSSFFLLSPLSQFVVVVVVGQFCCSIIQSGDFLF